jgi:uncharacterized membrane protein (DUF485 family)
MAVDDRPHPEVDWEAVERWPEFEELVRRRRSFVVPATIFFLAWYMGFILLAGYAPDFMAESVYRGLTVGYVLALTQFVMVAVLGLWYLRKADRDFDPLAADIVAEAERAQLDRSGRFAREARTGAGAEPEVQA